MRDGLAVILGGMLIGLIAGVSGAPVWGVFLSCIVGFIYTRQVIEN